MKNRICPGLAASLFLVCVTPAFGESLVCGIHVVAEGDSVDKLLEHCGEPDARDGNRWTYRQGQNGAQVVHVEAGTISLIQTEQD